MIVIFDLEGVLTQTISCYNRSWEQMAFEQGISLDIALEHPFCPQCEAVMMKQIMRKSHRTYSPAEQMALTARRSDIYDELIAEMKQNVFLPGAQDVLEQLSAEKVPMAAVANGGLPGRMLGSLWEKKLFQSVSRETEFMEQLQDTVRRLTVIPGDCMLVTAQKESVAAAKEWGMHALIVGQHCEQADYFAQSIRDIFWQQFVGDTLRRL